LYNFSGSFVNRNNMIVFVNYLHFSITPLNFVPLILILEKTHGSVSLQKL
jgi:hypothetical protein